MLPAPVFLPRRAGPRDRRPSLVRLAIDLFELGHAGDLTRAAEEEEDWDRRVLPRKSTATRGIPTGGPFLVIGIPSDESGNGLRNLAESVAARECHTPVPLSFRWTQTSGSIANLD